MGISKFSGLEIVSHADVTVQDFWAWAYSDILSNRNRSVFAEFLVAVALGLAHQPRVEWDAVDLRYGDKKIEVKSSAYIQSWQQRKPSLIKFDIGKKKGWDSESNLTAKEEIRSANCYVFCIYEEKDTKAAKQNTNILDIDKWSFVVVATETLDKAFSNQKSVSLSRLKQFGPVLKYGDLKCAIDLVVSLESSVF